MAGLLPLGISAQSLHITAGCRMVLSTSSYLVLNNTSFVNDGTLTAPSSSVVKFTGSSNPSVSIGGTSTSSFGALQLFRPTGDLTLNSDINLNFILSLNQGRIQLNNHILNLGSVGSILGENNTNYITGTSGGSILATASFLPTSPRNPGNIGLEITPAASSPAGVYTIERKHQFETLTAAGVVSIQRSYTITGTQSNAINLRLKFFYNDADIFDAVESQMVLWTGGGTVQFQQLGKDSNNTTANWVALSNIRKLGHFVLANPPGNNGDPSAGYRSGSQTGLAQNPLDAAAPTVSAVRAYPNPVHDQFTIDLYSDKANDIVIDLYDPSGHLLRQKKIHCLAGRNSISWDMSGFASGAYYLSFEKLGVKNLSIIKL